MSSFNARIEVSSMKILVCLLVLVAFATTTTITADKIAFATDRTTADDFDIWKMEDDGTNDEEITDESDDARNPSISRDGEKFVYDVFNSDTAVLAEQIWIVDKDGSNAVNLTGSLSNECSGTEKCADPDAGARINADNDFRIVFTRTYVDEGQTGNPTITEIWMATVDISVPSLGSFYQITDILAAAGAQIDPAWCGSDHVIWSRPTNVATNEICVVEVDSTGPVGSEQCYFDGTDDKDDTHPSCSLDASQIAWSRSTPYGTSDIFIMDCIDSPDIGDDQFDDCDTAGATNLTSTNDDDLHPVFDLGGDNLAWTISYDNGDDAEIWTMTTSGTHLDQLTDNSAEDVDPDWGPD
jgi:hypothetical protein